MGYGNGKTPREMPACAKVGWGVKPMKDRQQSTPEGGKRAPGRGATSRKQPDPLSCGLARVLVFEPWDSILRVLDLGNDWPAHSVRVVSIVERTSWKIRVGLPG